MKKLSAEVILTVMVAPIVIWFAGFIISSYKVEAEVLRQKSDIQEIKQDVKEIHSFLITKDR